MPCWPKAHTVHAFDPEAMNNAKQLLGDKIQYAENQYECLEGADALIIATEWNEFRTPNFLEDRHSAEAQSDF